MTHKSVSAMLIGTQHGWCWLSCGCWVRHLAISEFCWLSWCSICMSHFLFALFLMQSDKFLCLLKNRSHLNRNCSRQPAHFTTNAFPGKLARVKIAQRGGVFQFQSKDDKTWMHSMFTTCFKSRACHILFLRSDNLTFPLFLHGFVPVHLSLPVVSPISPSYLPSWYFPTHA